ncbi:MAG: DUF1295 domain-containing protein [Caulobacteraceae bacterium]|nr:DUF1295 domain-containing protein [Caulobacteraceae bacterium]
MLVALLLFYVAYFAAAFVWPTWRVWRRTGVSPLVLPKDDSTYGLVGNWFRGLLLALFAGIGAAAAGAPVNVFGPLSWLEREPARWLGWALLIAALAWTVIAQAQMGRSWRIGIDTENQAPLVQKGLFAISRNPIFLGMRVNLLGLFLVWPNALTALAMVVGEVLMQVQVRLEEQHLEATVGSPYALYREAVRRWL